ncbi:MAG: cell division/cell wall cluster transcriptional repressor MraZ [Spirochaetes bacterium]|mgnify:CR=1 FL=1|nr:MAG: cell division/cell wall cluster transcriptional repressor MraZ [Spirochaetota bacterium]
MITGEFKNSLDEKGRILIPSRLRSAITGNVMVLTRGVDRCLWLFPPEEWKHISGNLMGSTSMFNARARLIQRRIIAPAIEVEIDRAGRINIPPTLREYARLNKDCVILGIENRIELWDEGEYKNYWETSEAEWQQASEELSKII